MLSVKSKNNAPVPSFGKNRYGHPGKTQHNAVFFDIKNLFGDGETLEDKIPCPAVDRLPQSTKKGMFL